MFEDSTIDIALRRGAPIVHYIVTLVCAMQNELTTFQQECHKNS